MEVCPPGGASTRLVGLSVITLKEFVLLDEAKALLEVSFAFGASGTTCSSTFSTFSSSFGACSLSFSGSTSSVWFKLFSFAAVTGASSRDEKYKKRKVSNHTIS
jgi:hypothetical protein